MGRTPLTSTRWFELSGRELLVLIVGIALAAVALARGAAVIWRPADVTVSETGAAPPMPARLDVNLAPEHELSLLPGIGPKTASAIVAYREEHGPFRSLDDLRGVRGIGPATVERIRPHAMCAPRPESGPAPED